MEKYIQALQDILSTLQINDINIIDFCNIDDPIPTGELLYDDYNKAYHNKVKLNNVYFNSDNKGFALLLNNEILDINCLDFSDVESIVEHGEYFNNCMCDIGNSHNITEIHNITANVIISNGQTLPNHPKLVELLNLKAKINCYHRELMLTDYRVASENMHYGVDIFTREHMNMLEDENQYFNALCDIDYEPQSFFPSLEEVRMI